MGLIIWLAEDVLFVPGNKVENILYLFVTIPSGVLTYGIFLSILRFPESRKLIEKIPFLRKG
jgi:hypothetical protein